MITKENWPFLKNNNPLVIAGPCSAESEEQVMATALELKKDHRVNVLRAGIWKPRTRPGNFEGVGSIGLKWLQTAKQETGLPIAVEVANLKHVYEALKAGVDLLWIGARTTANPFAVQEIADALQGVDIPVLVKNPVNPDLALWIGALERLEKAGITQLGAIHRGVSQFGKSAFRNNPEWQLAIGLREQFPDMLLVNDPSHIAGNRELIQNISQTALDLKFDGLMIESHINPDVALSDAAQQVTPERLQAILDQLILKKENPEGVELQNISDLRKTISFIDKQIIDLLAYRMNIVEDIGRFKKKHEMTIFQENRWNDLLAKHLEQAGQAGLDTDFIAKIFHAIHQESIEKQSKIIND